VLVLCTVMWRHLLNQLAIFGDIAFCRKKRPEKMGHSLLLDIKLIEGVQRQATKLVTGMKELSYNDRLKQLGLQQLKGRRMRSDLIETFKIVNRKYDINPELFFQLDEGHRRGHDHKLFKKRFRLNVRKYSFSNRVTDSWNLLSANCVNCSTINTFKKHLSSEAMGKMRTCGPTDFLDLKMTKPNYKPNTVPNSKPNTKQSLILI